jgi:hypothetical protein
MRPSAGAVRSSSFLLLLLPPISDVFSALVHSELLRYVHTRGQHQRARYAPTPPRFLTDIIVS